MPERIQLRRTKGWRKPDGAIVVARPSKWGNPFVPTEAKHTAQAVDLYRRWLTSAGTFMVEIDGSEIRLDRIPEWDEPECLRAMLPRLRGHDLACWCPLDQPCHADVLLELANP